MGLSEDIRAKAFALGFDLVGITDASPVESEHLRRFTSWLDCGYAAGMMFMHRNLDKRLCPTKLLDGAKSVIVVGLGYKPRNGSASTARQGGGSHFGRVAAYAQYDDYHTFIRKRLRMLAEFLVATTSPALRFKICVDSTPLLERAMAVRAGLGFIGRNHMLINPRLGPQILLGEILTTIELAVDKPFDGRCPECDRCVAACPMGALKPDGCFDAGRCISYLTVEHDGDVCAELAPKIGDHLFGCCECLLACPFQQNAPACANRDFRFHPDRAALDLDRVLAMERAEFEMTFADSPLLRAGLPRLRRNAFICLHNLG